ncbi:fasciclin-like arabinogalactan protein 7 [Lolium rigidum]|uniref:fasciclin-like arabinogalactan protein 7 n=1 Tax=Lolium rigidum TaxID=89674 RepID=UPI001F5D76E1|nr:fasciclin-like arabinogalactan protein 7 [Lolium rigidum]
MRKEKQCLIYGFSLFAQSQGFWGSLMMEFRASLFTAAMLAIAVLSSPAFAVQKATSPPAPPADILPPSPAPAPAPGHVDLADLLSVAGPFSTFLEYLKKTDVLETFQSKANDTKEGITMFVPKNSAFAALRTTTFANLTGDQLKSLILYHALPKYYSLAEFNKLSSLNPVATFAGSQYTLNLTDNMGSIRVKSMWSNPKIISLFRFAKFSFRFHICVPFPFPRESQKLLAPLSSLLGTRDLRPSLSEGSVECICECAFFIGLNF